MRSLNNPKVFIFKNVDQTINNSNVLVNDNELKYTFNRVGYYEVEIYIRGSADNAADIKFAWTVTSGITIKTRRNMFGGGVNNTDDVWQIASMSMRDSQFFSDTPDMGMRNGGWGMERFIIQVTQATAELQFQWAQYTAHASNCSVWQGSYMCITPVVLK